MNQQKKTKLKELKARLAELKKHDPSHCSDKESFVPHSIPPELFGEIEELEEEIAKLESE